MHDDVSLLINRPATLVFRTIHIDRAGETSNVVAVKAEIADVTPDRQVLLVTRSGVFVHFPVESLFPRPTSGKRNAVTRFIGGQELTRDFHPMGDAPHTHLRWLSRDEVERLLEKPRGS